MTGLNAGWSSDVGRRRSENEDMVLVDEPLFAVADGMGGHVFGEVAALTAIEALRAGFRSQPSVDSLVAAIKSANRAVIERAASDPRYRGMGTTLVAAALVDNPDGDESGDDVIAIANVGDSRLYLLRDGELTQLTEDHSLVAELVRSNQLSPEEAVVHPDRNIITRSLGQWDDVDPDIQQLIPYRGDRLLLCSDGLTDEVREPEIAEILRTVADPTEAATGLVRAANDHGGRDNISVVVIDVVDDDDRAEHASATLAAEPPPGPQARTTNLLTANERDAQLRALEGEEPDAPLASWRDTETPTEHRLPRTRVTPRVVLFVALVAALLVGAVAAIGWYARGSYYVGFDAGRVAIYKGRPGGLLWFKPSVKGRTDITEASVPAATRADLEAGKEEPTLAAAQRYVANLRDQVGGSAGDGSATTDTTASTDTTVPLPTVTGAPPSSSTP